MSTGFATLASAGRSALQRRLVSSPSAGSSRPAASQASAQRIPRPPAFVRTRDAVAPRQRLRREERRDVEQLLERRGADHARLAEERVDGRVRARERRRVRARRPRPGAVVPLLSARIGFVRATRRATRPNLRGLPNDSR